jgi:hypothetical protein
MNEIQTELQSALATARHALEQFKAEPMIPSKRGGPRLSPWFRAWKEASEVAQRWHRQIQQRKPTTIYSFDHELEQLLDEAQGQ